MSFYRLAFVALFTSVFGCGHGNGQKQELQSENRSKADSSGDVDDGVSASFSVPKDEATAIAAFRSQALTSLPKNIDPEKNEFVINTINDEKAFSARQATCESCFNRMDNTLTQDERESLILLGSISDLQDRPGNCWEIMAGRYDDAIEGYLDIETGKLLVIWIVPEG